MTQPTDRIPLAAAYRVPPDTKRAQAIAGLRALAQMIEDHPDLPTPYSITAQAGPTDGNWDTQRQVVIAAARVLGQPLNVDSADTCSVRAKLSDWSGPYVAYVVHATADEPESAPDTSPAAAAAEVPADLAPQVAVPAELLEDTPVDPLAAILAHQHDEEEVDLLDELGPGCECEDHR